jgi:hypothetical protein
MNKADVLKTFFDAILKGETITYNDYGYYVCTGSISSCYRSYIKGSTRYSRKFPTMPRDLETYTVAEIMRNQALSKDSSTGQLFGVGRYAIIPVTLKGLVNKNKTNVNLKFTPALQDQFGYYLLMERKNLRNYITKAVPDTTANLQAAALDLAKIWSSIGIPYDMQITWNGDTYNQVKNGSYYRERVGVKTEAAQTALKQLRANLTSATDPGTSSSSNLFFLALLAGGYYFYRKFKKNKS